MTVGPQLLPVHQAAGSFSVGFPDPLIWKVTSLMVVSSAACAVSSDLSTSTMQCSPWSICTSFEATSRCVCVILDSMSFAIPVRRVFMLSSFVSKSVWSDLSSFRTSAKLAVRLVSVSLAIVGNVVFVGGLSPGNKFGYFFITLEGCSRYSSSLFHLT